YMDHYYDGSENGSENERDAQIIDTTASEETMVNFRLIRGTTISGRVADSNGDPAAEVSVEAWSRNTGFYGSSVTAEDGTYIIEGLGPAPDYKVEAREQDIGSFFHNSEKTVRDRSLAESVSTADGDPEDIDIMLTEIESISGKVTDMEGYPLPLMWVDAWSELHQSGNGVFTDEDGRYEVSGLPKSRDYMVSARPDWFTVPQEKTDISSNSVEVNFVLNPREGYTLTGTVISSTGVSIPNVSVEAWSASLNIRGDIWSVTDRTGNYQLDGLPKADDYMLIVSPPKDSSYASFNEKEISVPLDGDAHNIVLSRGLNVSGTVMAKADGSPITDAQVIVISSENNFWKETVTDRYGRYNIGNMSDISDYEITVMSDSHLGQTKTEQSPGSGTDFALDRSGDISGEVKDKSTGEVRAGARVEAYSESMQGMSEFAGVAITDGDGRYVIKGLKPTDQRGNPLSDYVITVYAKGYPPLSKGARRVGDELNFALTRGKENELSGTVMGFEGELLDEIEFIGEIFERGGDYISFVKVDSDGTFKFTGLDSEKLYQVMFTAYRGDTPELIQWAAEGPSDEYDIGIESIDDPYQTPANARAYKTDTTVHFRFSYTLKRKRGRSVRGPGPVTNIDSPTHIFTKR
ncbi:MAG TPA: carboxypeptidase regulatory-like domain-containing protein, partial [Desulfobacterales bacterium]|nr:carboxypeptidase regulatory-like domain-containing protein [Desulfobacterales bacterium]